MLRFPNPGSTIENFVNVYNAAFAALSGRVVNLDDIVDTVVRANLATSSGYMGAEAVTRSTREDRSRDPLYNQLKMYAELFRTLGWLHPTRESALNFTFTLLGEQVVAAGRDYWPLLEECILGIAYPTRILSVRGEFDLRPFACILRVMAECGGYISRDEMIVGPLSAPSDRGDGNLKRIAGTVLAIRKSRAATDAALKSVAKTRSTQVNTLHNYTRWPIAVLRDTGWAEQAKVQYADGKAYQAWCLTNKGREVVTRLTGAMDIRVLDIEALPGDLRNAISVLAHYQMLERAGFDIKPVEPRLLAAHQVAKPFFDKHGFSGANILFSPFQALSLDDVDATFPSNRAIQSVARQRVAAGVQVGRNDRSHLFVQPRLVSAAVLKETGADTLRSELTAYLKKSPSLSAAAAAFTEAHSGDTQTTFYPLVTHLFQVLGFRSDYSRAGVNYQRWDACVWVGDHALPVEIKSPTEEVFLSTKAVRQALENKVVLLSRGGLKTRRDLTSLIVGNKLPNERGDMSNLIDDVFTAYGLSLGVLDLQVLGHLALRAIQEGVTIDQDQLSQLRGFLSV